ncbi:MAG: HD domain-containing protein [bacterium]
MSEEAVADILRQGRIYEVGGAVRDRMLPGDTSVKDRDYLVTGIPYADLSAILKRHGRVDLVGQSFGVIKFTQLRDGQMHTCDISLPRTEHSTGWGHRDFDVSFDPDITVEDDLVRRDFTVNAMAVSLEDMSLIDPLGGLADLKQRRLRMVHEHSFEEDPLRMLRAVQFAARFEFDIEEKTFLAMKQQAAGINTVSAERIAEELNKLLTLARRPSIGFRLMNESGLLEHVLPELHSCVGVDQPGPYHAYDVFEHTLHSVDAAPRRLRVRMAALFHDIFKPIAKRPVEGGATFYGHEVQGAKVARKALNRLRYSKEFIRDVAVLVERHMFTTDVTDKGMRRLVRRVGVHLIFDLLDLRRADVVAQGKGGTTDDVDEFEQAIRDELDRQPPLSTSDLVLDGHDLMKRYGLKPGPAVGKLLNQLLEVVLDDPQENTVEKLTAVADGLFDDIKNDCDRE